MRFCKTAEEWGDWEKVYPKNSLFDGKYSEVATLHETIHGSIENPIPVCLGKLMRVDLRKDHTNRRFYTSTNSASTNRQIVINNGEYQMKLRKILTDTGLSNAIYIEIDGRGQKHHLGNLSTG